MSSAPASPSPTLPRLVTGQCLQLGSPHHEDVIEIPDFLQHLAGCKRARQSGRAAADNDGVPLGGRQSLRRPIAPSAGCSACTFQPVAQTLMCPTSRDRALCEPVYPKSALVTVARSGVP